MTAPRPVSRLGLDDCDLSCGLICVYRRPHYATETLPLRPFCRSCIIATCGYDFRKGQVAFICRFVRTRYIEQRDVCSSHFVLSSAQSPNETNAGSSATRNFVPPLAPHHRLAKKPELSLLKIPPRGCDNDRRSIIDNLHNFRCNTARSHQDFSTSGCAKFKRR
jgi:hypothetical protein